MPSYMHKQYAIADVLPGMELGERVVGDDKFVLCRGFRLTSRVIERLKSWGVACVDIREQQLEPKVVQAIREMPAWQGQYAASVNLLKRSFEVTRNGQELPVIEVKEITSQCLESLLAAPEVVGALQNVHSFDDYTFYHSVNVGIIAGIIGKWLGYKRPVLEELVLGGLLHDVGKTQIPPQIINKPGCLTAAELRVVRQHTRYGYQLVQKLPNLPSSTPSIVLQHHERNDGSGYPNGDKGDRIHDLAKVVAVADFYDAITSDRIYRTKIPPFAAIAILEEMTNKFDPAVLNTFLANIRQCFIGSRVKLSDGRYAMIVSWGKTLFSKPQLKIESGQLIDLKQNRAITIAEMVTR